LTAFRCRPGQIDHYSAWPVALDSAAASAAKTAGIRSHDPHGPYRFCAGAHDWIVRVIVFRGGATLRGQRLSVDKIGCRGGLDRETSEHVRIRVTAVRTASSQEFGLKLRRVHGVGSVSEGPLVRSLVAWNRDSRRLARRRGLWPLCPLCPEC
jgi:hypothetical protein